MSVPWNGAISNYATKFAQKNFKKIAKLTDSYELEDFQQDCFIAYTKCITKHDENHSGNGAAGFMFIFKLRLETLLRNTLEYWRRRKSAETPLFDDEMINDLSESHWAYHNLDTLERYSIHDVDYKLAEAPEHIKTALKCIKEEFLDKPGETNVTNDSLCKALNQPRNKQDIADQVRDYLREL